MNTIETLRSFRVGGYAVFDFGVSFLVMALLGPLLSNLIKRFGIMVPVKNWIFLTLPLSIVIHLLVGNHTLMTKNIIDPNGHFILKAIILLLTLLSFWGIRKL
jgi:hypothetical protein